MTPRPLFFALTAAISLLLMRPSHAGEFALDHIIITLQPGTDAQSYFQDEWPRVRSIGSAYTLELGTSTAEQILAECDQREKDPRVRYAEPDAIGTIDPPPIPTGLLFPSFSSAALPGSYVGTVTIRRVLAEVGLSSRYMLKAEARMASDGRILILTTVPESPSVAASSGATITRAYPNPEASAPNNYLVAPQIPALLIQRENQLKLTYSTTSAVNTDSPIVTEFEFLLRKRTR